MISSKKIGFYWGEEKLTAVEFEKNMPTRVFSAPLSAKSNIASALSSNLTEEIQITAVVQKMLQDNNIAGGEFYVSLPMKEIILRSFIIPSVKNDEIANAIKFEAKKYMPFDIQDLSFVFHTIPFAEDRNKRLQVIFFAVRKEVLAKYERIFKQVNAEIAYCEPYTVSLTKALLYKKEIKATDHLAFLILNKNLGRICFIDNGIPQFIREFPISIPEDADERKEPVESTNSKIVNEVGNSFDFYARQFSGERIEQIFVCSEFVQRDLLANLEAELKVKITKFSPFVTSEMGQSADMDRIYAMGACIPPPIESLEDFNFLGDKKPRSQLSKNVVLLLNSYKEAILVLVICCLLLAGAHFYFQNQLKSVQTQYDQLAAQEGSDIDETVDTIQGQLQANTDLLAKYKSIRTRSDVAFVILKIASHLPKGVELQQLDIRYEQTESGADHVNIDLKGDVFKGDPNHQFSVANQITTDIKQDKSLSSLISKVSLISLNQEQIGGEDTTGFTIHCS